MSAPRPPLAAVVFDYGHTLLDVTWDDAARRRGEQRLLHVLGDPVGADRFHDAVECELSSAQASAGEFGEIDYPAVAAAALRSLGADPPPALLARAIAAEVTGGDEPRRLQPDALGLLDDLRRRGLRLGVVTNTVDPPELVSELIARDGVRERIDALVLSSELGLRKPAPAIYRAVLDELGVPAGATLFVGDRVAEDVSGPAAAGMLTCLATWFRSDEGDHRLADFVAATPADVERIAARLATAPGG